MAPKGAIFICMNIDRFFDSKDRYLVRQEKSLSQSEIQQLYITYNDSLSIKETICRLHHNIDTHPKCTICGKLTSVNPNGWTFKKTCGNKKCIAKLRKQNSRETKFKRYGSPIYNNQEKHKETCLIKYGNKSFTNPEKRFKQT